MTNPGVKYDAAVAMRARVAEVARLRALLKRLEWGRWGSECPCCGGLAPGSPAPYGHADGCELAAELYGSEAVRTA